MYGIKDGKIVNHRVWGHHNYDTREEAEKALQDSYVYYTGPSRTRVYPRGGAGEPYWRYSDNADRMEEAYRVVKETLRILRKQGNHTHEEIMETLKKPTRELKEEFKISSNLEVPE